MTTVGNPVPTGRQRLDSWKEIAGFFGRDGRTVNRWEKELGLPVYRLPGKSKGRVYAYTDELAEWAEAPRVATAISSEPALQAEVAGSTPGPVLVAQPDRRSRARWTVAAMLAALGVFGLWFLFHPGTGQMLSRPIANRPSSASGVVLASSPSHNPAAEQLYLKGRYYWNKRTPDDLNKAVDYFTQAIVRDPGYSQAYVGLADCYNLLREYTMMPADEAYTRALAAAQKAVELDDQSSEAHASLGFVLFFGSWNGLAAEREFRRAIDLDPNNAKAHHWYASYLVTVRRFPESLTEIERAQTLDPDSTSILADKAALAFTAGQQKEGIKQLKQMEAANPAFLSPHRYLRYAYFGSGDYPDFLAESRNEALLLHDQTTLAITTSAEKGYAAGGSKGMLEALLQAQKKFYDRGLVPPSTIAQTSALLGHKDEALQYLKVAYDQHDEFMIYLSIFPAFNSLHQEPAYRDLSDRMNLPVQN